ncbi:DUF3267 domain-containing protein [Salibacterium lacus]|uniref:DUF3267 domain-containing protein n=1 Tax=Salibacterium lacus TaxID=1898109 RepID=A0ABW5SWM9_9BACI
MNCWKSINVKRDYHTSRLMIFSFSMIIVTFILGYLGLSLYHRNDAYTELSMLHTLLFLILLFPVHTFLHVIPLRFAGVHIDWSRLLFRRKRKAMQFLKFTRPVTRNYYIGAMIFPACIINVGAAAGAFLFPSLMHYFVLVFSFNSGLAVYDLIYIKQLLGAPRHCYIEQNRNGLDILVKQPV